MSRAIVGWSIRFRLVVLGLAAAVVVLGLVQLAHVPIEAMPEFAPPYVEIQTEALGLSAEEVEQLVTVPLEADLLLGVAWVDTMRSQSLPGLSSIVLTFEQGTDPLRARQMVTERLTQAHALPNVSKPPQMLPPLSSSSRVMIVALTSKDVSLIDLSVLARWTIRPTLMGVPGVANVAIWGQRERQLQVLVDPARLLANGVSLEDVIQSTGNALWISPLTFLDASTPGTGGFIDTPNQRLGIQHVLPIHDAADLAKVTLANDDTQSGTLTIGDVATVVVDHQPLIGDAVVGDGAGLLLVVEKFPGADTLEVSRGLDHVLKTLGPGLAGIDMDATVFRPATYLEDAGQNLGIVALLGLVLMLLTGIFLGGIRRAVVQVLAVTTTLAIVGVALLAIGGSINFLLVAGIALAVGVLVDDAVVGARATQGGDIRATAARSRAPLAFALVAIALATAPAFFVDGPPSPFIAAMAIAFVVAVAASTLVAHTVTPALASFLLTGAERNRATAAAGTSVRAGYVAFLQRVSRHSRVLVAATAMVAIASVVVLGVTVTPQLGGPLLPELKQRDVLVAISGPAGASRDEMRRIVADISGEIRGVTGVRDVGAHIGRAIASDQVAGIDSGEIWVSIDEAGDYDSTLAAVRAIVDRQTEAAGAVSTYAAQRTTALLGGPTNDVVVRVYGQDLQTIAAQADALGATLLHIPGIDTVTVQKPLVQPTVEISVDLAAAARAGVKPGDVRRAATTLISGLEVGSLFEDQKIFGVVVRAVADIRDSVDDIGNLPIDTPTGGTVRLGDIAMVTVANRPSAIAHESVFRYLDVAANVQGRDIDEVLRDVRGAAAATAFPREYHAEVFSPAADQKAALIRLLAVVGIVILGAYLVLQAAFGSWRRAAVLLLLPAAVSGGAIGMVAAGRMVSIGELAGFVAVVAIAIRQVTCLFADYREREWSRGDEPGIGLVVEGARERLGAIMATNLATIAALLPVLVLGDVAGLEILRPMAAVIVGGLCTATLFVLFVAPAVYLVSGPVAEPETLSGLLAEGQGVSPA